MDLEIRAMELADYDEVYQLWSVTEGMTLGEDDSHAGLALYLKRNPGLCFVAEQAKKIVGTLLCGHDGRRGILRHLAVRSECRKQGIARLLVQSCLDGLYLQGIKKCNIFVMDYNVTGLQFWKHMGFYHLPDDYRTLQLGTKATFSDEPK